MYDISQSHKISSNMLCVPTVFNHKTLNKLHMSVWLSHGYCDKDSNLKIKWVLKNTCRMPMGKHKLHLPQKTNLFSVGFKYRKWWQDYLTIQMSEMFLISKHPLKKDSHLTFFNRIMSTAAITTAMTESQPSGRWLQALDIVYYIIILYFIVA